MSDFMGMEAFDGVERVIVIAAHPDDMEVTCAGTLVQLIARGVEVHSVNCTLGDIGTHDPAFTCSSLAARRLEETAEAARILGIKSHYTLGRHDGELVADLALRAEIARLYRITQADALFTFDRNWSGEIHPDHRAVGRAAIDAFMPSKMPLYHPEHLNEAGAGLGKISKIFLFNPTDLANVIVDIAAVRARKIEALGAHKSQFTNGTDDLPFLTEWEAQMGKRAGYVSAESFRTLDVW